MSVGKDLFDLSGRVALITGSTRGIGHTAATALAHHGATVVISSRSEADVNSVVQSFQDQGHRALGVPMDLLRTESIEGAVRQVHRDLGRLDILVNNAGVTVRKPLDQHGLEDWRRVLSVNLDACFYLSKLAAEIMIPRKWGRIIMVSSIAGALARGSIPGYVASKSGVNGLVRALAAELGEHGICVNALAPGYFPTAANATVRMDSEFHDKISRRTAMARWGELDELAGAFVYFASAASSYCTGTVLPVDGGMSITI